MNRSVVGAIIFVTLLAGFGINQWVSANHRTWVRTASQSALEQYVPTHPTDISAKVQLGQINVANKDARGIEMLRAAAESSPGDEAVWFAYVDAITDPNEAMASIDTYLKVLPDSIKLRAAKARRLVELGDPLAGLSMADDLIKVAGKDADVLRARADALMLLHRVQQASDSLVAAIAQDDRSELRLLLAMTLVPQQRYRELRDVCLPIVANGDVGIAEGQSVRAKLYLAGAALNLATPLDDIQKTTTELEGMLQKTNFFEPQEQFLPYYFLGECYLRNGRIDDARKVLFKAVRMAPQFPAALYSLARAVQATKDVSTSSVLFKRHAELTSLLSQIDGLNTRAQEKMNDAVLIKQLDIAQQRLNRLLSEPLPSTLGK